VSVRSEVTLTAFDGHKDYATGVGSWIPAAGGATRSYRFTVSLPSNTPDSQEGASVTGVDLTWEVVAGT
jgi:hypothetical protein